MNAQCLSINISVILSNTTRQILKPWVTSVSQEISFATDYWKRTLFGFGDTAVMWLGGWLVVECIGWHRKWVTVSFAPRGSC
jgi:hypothetical protein